MFRIQPRILDAMFLQMRRRRLQHFEHGHAL
jgi:hypothetical protein